MTHQFQGEEEDEEDGTGDHGQAQQQSQGVVLADAGELAIQRLMFQLLVIQQVLPLGWHGHHCVSHIAGQHRRCKVKKEKALRVNKTRWSPQSCVLTAWSFNLKAVCTVRAAIRDRDPRFLPGVLVMVG